MSPGGMVPGMMMGGMLPPHLMAMPGMQPVAQPGYVSLDGAAGAAPFGVMDEAYYQRLAEMQAAAVVDPQQAALMAVAMSDVMATGAQFGGVNALGDPSAAAAAAAAMQALSGGGGGGAEAHSGGGRRRRSKISHNAVGEGTAMHRAAMYRDDVHELGGPQSNHMVAGASRRLRKERCVIGCSFYVLNSLVGSAGCHWCVGDAVRRYPACPKHNHLLNERSREGGL
jgi:hypothetical protein